MLTRIDHVMIRVVDLQHGIDAYTRLEFKIKAIMGLGRTGASPGWSKAQMREDLVHHAWVLHRGHEPQRGARLLGRPRAALPRSRTPPPAS